MTITISGHLDTAKATTLKKEIEAKVANTAASEHLIIDCSDLEYISSSGLRIMLVIMKMHPDMEITGVSPEIYNVFEISGFTRILTIHKAVRKIDLSKCKFIGEGANGAVYRINEEEIVKISKFPQGEASLIKESEQVREAFLMGVPTVISFDTVDSSDGHKGIVMEALDSDSLGMYINQHPECLDDIIPKYVQLFRQTNEIHTNSPLFRNLKEWLRSHLYLPGVIITEEEAALMSDLLDEIPDADNFIHFDGHAGNVLMYGNGDDRNLMLIDLGDAGTGHPILEIAGWAFMMLEPDYAEGCSVADRVIGMSRPMMKEFGRRVIAEMFHVTDQAQLDTLLYQASLIGRIKSAYIGLRWYSIVTDQKFKEFIKRAIEDTISLLPEIREAIRTFVKLYE